jgi:hypothetical protein
VSTGQKLKDMPVESAAILRVKQDSRLSTNAEAKKGGVLSNAQLASLLWRRWKCHLSSFVVDGITFELTKPPVVNLAGQTTIANSKGTQTAARSAIMPL